MFLMLGMSILIILVGGHKIDEGALQIGQMTSFITYSMLIVMSFLMLTMLALIVPRAMVASGRIDEVITTESSIKNADNAVELKNPDVYKRQGHERGDVCQSLCGLSGSP